MLFQELSNDMKLAIMNKMNYNTVSELRQCSRNSYNLISRIFYQLQCSKVIERAVFDFPWLRLKKFDINIDKKEGYKKAVRFLANRSIRQMEVLDWVEFPTFCRESNISVCCLRPDFFNEPYAQLALQKVLAIVRPHLLTLRDRFISHQFNQLTVSKGLKELIVSSWYQGTLKKIDVPVGIESILTEEVRLSETSLNRAIKRWSRGKQRIGIYVIISPFITDKQEMFKGIKLEAWTQQTCIERTRIEKWIAGEEKNSFGDTPSSPPSFSPFFQSKLSFHAQETSQLPNCRSAFENAVKCVPSGKRFVIWRRDNNYLMVAMICGKLVITGPGFHSLNN